MKSEGFRMSKSNGVQMKNGGFGRKRSCGAEKKTESYGIKKSDVNVSISKKWQK